MLQWGPHVEGLLKVEQSTGETPLALLNRPTPSQWTVEYWDAFHALSGSRNYTSAGPAGIPISEMLSYFFTHGIHSLTEQMDYVEMIQKMDSVYLNHYAEKSKVK